MSGAALRNIADFGMDTITLAGTLPAKLAAVREAGFGQIMLLARDITGHAGGIDELLGKLLEEIVEQQDGKAQAEGDLHDDDAQVLVEQTEVAHLDEERENRRGRGKQQPQQQVTHQELAAEELDVCECEARH